jgi:hypothetical protein
MDEFVVLTVFWVGIGIVVGLLIALEFGCKPRKVFLLAVFWPAWVPLYGAWYVARLLKRNEWTED